MSPKFSKDEMDSTTDLRQLKDGAEYMPYLDYRKTAEALVLANDTFQRHFCELLNLIKVPSPLMVLAHTGVNDYQKSHIPIVCDVLDVVGKKAEVVRSLGKWKRLALNEYDFAPGEGLYADMHAVRQDESLDNTHSIHVEQWDWERVMGPDERNVDFLCEMATAIYETFRKTEIEVCRCFRELPAPILPEKMFMIFTEDLERRYPDLSPQEREDQICKEEGAVFLIGIGSRSYESRSVDHDDWSSESKPGHVGLNGDFLVWHPILGASIEIHSMGIRVDSEALLRQLKLRDNMDRANLFYHQKIIRGECVPSVGGGIGKSRLNMYFLRKAHIGEVQVAIWPEKMVREMSKRHIPLLSDAPGLVEGRTGEQRRRRRWLFPM